MANVRDSDTSLWLHNKLGTSNDSWISGSICSQLNKEVLRNIKECFADLQTQVKLKLLLSFFHIPRRLVEEWKAELEEVIEAAGLDTELWVSMLAETMKTFPATSSLNTEISEYEDTRHIFTDMVNDLRKLVSKQSDLGMLPLECQYLNKSALISVVGQQPMPVKHFTLKRKPKSAQLRVELMHKSAEAQSSLKKSSAPTIPLRSRGMPRKMTDTTPMKGIPSRVPTTGGFRSPNVAGPGAQRPNLSRTPAGRKDGGIKIIDYTDQPLGFVAAKKRKREQQLEEQQKKEQQKAAAAAAAAERCTSPTPAGSSPQPTTPTTAAATPTTPTTIKTEAPLPETPTLNQSASSALDDSLNDSAAVKEEDQSMVVEEAGEAVDAVKTAEDTGLAGGESGADDSAAEQAASAATTPQAATTSKASNAKAANVATTPTTGRGKAKGTKRQNQSAKANAANATSSPTTTTAAATATTVTNTTTATTNNNNNNNNNNSIVQTAGKKRPKQTIEIKSEEIIVPPTIKLEKIDMPLPTVQQQQQQAKKLPQQQAPQPQLPVQQGQASPQKMPRLQQRVIIQQQPPQQMPSLTSIQQPKGPNNTQHVLIRAAPQPQKQTLTLTRAGGGVGNTPTAIKLEKPSGSLLTTATSAANPLANLPNNISVKITSTKAAGNKAPAAQQQQQQPILINSNTPVILAPSSSPSSTPQTIRQKAQTLMANNAATSSQALKSTLSQLKSATSSGPVIISQTIIQPAKRTVSAGQQQQQQQPPQLVPQQAPQQPQQQQQATTTTTKYIITSAAGQTQNTTQMPSLTSFTQPQRTVQQQQQQQVNTFQTSQQQQQQNNTGQATKILLKTSGGSGVVMTPVRQQQQGVPTMLNLQNVQLPNRPVTIQPASQAAQQQHLQAQMQQQQQHTIVANTTATQQPKLTQVLMQTGGASNIGEAASGAGGVVTAAGGGGVKNKAIILTPKGLIFRNISGDMYESIPISNVSGLQGLNATAGGGGTGNTLMANAAGPPGLVKTQPQTIQLQTSNKPAQAQQLPTLIPTGSMAPQHVIVQQQQQTSTASNILGTAPQQTIIRPVISNVSGGLATLPQGLTLIQRPGQQPQLLQVQSTGTQAQQQQQTQQRTIIAQPGQQMRQQIVLQQRPVQQRIITTTSNAGWAPAGQQANNQQIQIQRTIVQVPKQQQQAQQQPNQSQQQPAPQRRGLTLSTEHVQKAHVMFRKANRVSRPDKALILGFMAGQRENPRPNSENVIIIKLGETEEKVQQEDGSTSLCLVESLIRLDYNTGEWKTFQNYRRLDQSASQAGGSNDGGNIMQAQNSVVI